MDTNNTTLEATPAVLAHARATQSIRQLTTELNALSPARWARAGASGALDLFHEANRRVPAYRSFLRRHGVHAADVRCPAQFEEVPATTSDNYLNRYPVSELMWDGDGDGASRAPSGRAQSSVGNRSWPVSADESISAAINFELFFYSQLAAARRTTLLAVYVGDGLGYVHHGVVSAGSHMRQAGYPVSTLAPRVGAGRLAQQLVTLAPDFDQTLIVSTPELVREVLDEARKAEPAWCGRVAVLICGGSASFSEEWREGIARRMVARGCEPVVRAALWTQEAGLTGFESERSVAFRRAATANGKKGHTSARLAMPPMMFHYVPTYRWLECVSGTLVVTARRAVPLIRFDTRAMACTPGTGYDDKPRGAPTAEEALGALPSVLVH